MAFERIHVRGPELTEWRQPGIDLLKGFRFEAIQTALGVDRGLHEAGFAQNAQVLRYRRLRHAQPTLDLAHRLFRRREEAENRAAVRLGDDFENTVHASLYTSTCIYLSSNTRQDTHVGSPREGGTKERIRSAAEQLKEMIANGGDRRVELIVREPTADKCVHQRANLGNREQPFAEVPGDRAEDREA